MADTVDRATRSRMMAGIRGRNTVPELLVRRALHAKGFRFRLHVANLPGRPDLVLKKHHAVVFVHGCFWHGHDCHYFKMPTTRRDFWSDKIAGNRRRDEHAVAALIERGWKSAIVWECALRGKGESAVNKIAEQLALWLTGSSRTLDIRG